MAPKKPEDVPTQPRRPAVARRPPADLSSVATTPGRAAVKRKADAPRPDDVTQLKTTVGRSKVTRRPRGGPQDALVERLAGLERVRVARRREITDARGEEGVGYALQDGDDELCRFVVQGAGLLGALVDSLRFELEDVFEWLEGGELLGHLVVTWKEAQLLDAGDRLLCRVDMGVFGEQTRMSFRLRPGQYPRAMTVWDGATHEALFDVGLTRNEQPVPVSTGHRTWAFLSRTFRSGLLGIPRQDGLQLESNASFPGLHRLYAATAAAATDYLILEYEARHSLRR